MPARHASKARRAGHRVIAGGRSEPHLISTLQSELVLSVAEGTGEDARLPARRAYSSERRTVISAVAAGNS